MPSFRPGAQAPCHVVWQANCVRAERKEVAGSGHCRLLALDWDGRHPTDCNKVPHTPQRSLGVCNNKIAFHFKPRGPQSKDGIKSGNITAKSTPACGAV